MNSGYRKGKISKNCEVCQKSISLFKCNARIRFCSKQCYWVSMKGKAVTSPHYQITSETRKKMSLAKIGKVSNALGMKHSEVSKSKMPLFKGGHTPWNKGLKLPQFSKENHPNWIEDRTNLKRFNNTQKDRRSSAYATWRKEVWLRDNFKCKIDNAECSGRIEAHHILGFTEHPELRYIINNGITLCHAHHPRKRAEEKRLIPTFQELVLMPVSSEQF